MTSRSFELIYRSALLLKTFDNWIHACTKKTVLHKYANVENKVPKTWSFIPLFHKGSSEPVAYLESVNCVSTELPLTQKDWFQSGTNWSRSKNRLCQRHGHEIIMTNKINHNFDVTTCINLTSKLCLHINRTFVLIKTERCVFYPVGLYRCVWWHRVCVLVFVCVTAWDRQEESGRSQGGLNKGMNVHSYENKFDPFKSVDNVFTSKQVLKQWAQVWTTASTRFVFWGLFLKWFCLNTIITKTL